MKVSFLILMNATLMFTVPISAVFGQEPEIKAATITVTVGPFKDNKGQLSCALHDKKDGFPMNFKIDNAQVHPIEEGNYGICVFEDVPAGVYALAVMHDKNGDNKLNTNFLGIPKEPWAVSNNVRPSLRAPKFKEAKFEILNGEQKKFDLEVR